MVFEQFVNPFVLIAFMGILIIYLLYYVFTKDSEYSRNIRSVASVVEDLNKEVFHLQNKLKDTQKTILENRSRMSDSEIYEEIERSVHDMVYPISMGIKSVQENLEIINENIDSRVSALENGVKQISMPSSVYGNDDDKIITLYKQGVSLDTISKELHLSKPEVEFVLKINKIK
jgi:hypothetical protein